MDIAYLAAPYSHPDPLIKQERHQIVNRVVYYLMRKGTWVYSPLTHNLPIDQLGIHGSWTTWGDFDLEMLSRCDRLIVLKLPGWENSRGVTQEIDRAEGLGMEIEWMECPDFALAVV